MCVAGTRGKVTDRAIALVAINCPRLRRLDVSNTDGSVTAESIEAVARHCPQLHALEAYGGSVDSEVLHAIAARRTGMVVRS